MIGIPTKVFHYMLNILLLAFLPHRIGGPGLGMSRPEFAGDVVLGDSGEGVCTPYLQNRPDLGAVTRSDLTDGWSCLLTASGKVIGTRAASRAWMVPRLLWSLLFFFPTVSAVTGVQGCRGETEVLL